VPLITRGLLITEDGKVLCPVHEAEDISLTWNRNTEADNVSALGTNRDNNIRSQKKRAVHLQATLTEKSVGHLDKIRNRNKKGDVNFKLALHTRVMASKALVCPLYLLAPDVFPQPLVQTLKSQGASIAAYKYVSDYQGQMGNLWLISGDNGPTFLSISDVKADLSGTIHASDWIHDFSPQLGIGRFLVAELPLPETVASGSEFSDRLSKAYKALQEVREKIVSGEWTEAVQKTRPIAELLRNEALIKETLCKHGGDEVACNSLLGSIKSLFEYGSRFIHKVDKDGKTLPPDILAQKEDAYLVYSMSVSLLNLIAQKARKPEPQ